LVGSITGSGKTHEKKSAYQEGKKAWAQREWRKKEKRKRLGFGKGEKTASLVYRVSRENREISVCGDQQKNRMQLKRQCVY